MGSLIPKFSLWTVVDLQHCSLFHEQEQTRTENMAIVRLNDKGMHTCISLFFGVIGV